jgi:CrcB protein
MSDVMTRILLVGLGGFAGANVRYWLGGWISHRWGAAFPWATFAINISGSFALGVFVALVANRLVHPAWRLVIPIGFIGAYTTFSTFEYETFELVEGGGWWFALLNAVGSLIVGFIAVWVGLRLGERL